MLVYSGDVDAIVPVTGSRRWVHGLQLPEVTPWAPYITAGQVGGFWQSFEGLSFATVRGAGHMCPYTQPARSQMLFRWLLKGLPATGPGGVQ